MNKKGFAPVLVLVIAAVAIVAAAGASYYILQSAGKAPGSPIYQQPASYYPRATGSSEASVSESTSISDLEDELDSTGEGSIEKDLQELDSAASSL